MTNHNHRLFRLLLVTTTTLSVRAFSTNSRPLLTPLEECTFAGNLGFDPCQFATTRRSLWHYRESEIKHARVAMLASLLVWLTGSVVRQEELEKEVMLFPWYDNSELLVVEPVLQHVAPVWWGACVGVLALCELNTQQRDEQAIDFSNLNNSNRDYAAPGQLGWDPLHLFPDNPNQQQQYLNSEIWSGRAAMLGMIVPLSQQGQDWWSELE